MRYRILVLALMTAVVGVAAVTPAVGAPQKQRADVLEQGGEDVYAEDGAVIARRKGSLRITLKVPTPQPGTYVYPEGAVPGDLEIFTGWAFVFNNPEKCTDPCNGDDIGGPANVAIYHMDGRVAWSDELFLRARFEVGDVGRNGGTLTRPKKAEVHVAIAPHGAVDPAILLEQLTDPIGTPACGCWWVALFK